MDGGTDGCGVDGRNDSVRLGAGDGAADGQLFSRT